MTAPGFGPTPPPPPPGSPATEVERIRASVAQYFPVYETRITPTSLVLLVHADPASIEERFDRLRQEMWTRYYVPQIRYERGEYVVEVVRRPTRRPWSSYANLILLAFTVITTVAAGAFLWLAYVGGSALSGADFLYGGLYFGLPLMLILGLHELAHFLLARHHHVEASLPYFIPVPPPYLLFGTFGAFISLREPIPTKKALLDIGASGPIAGFVVSIPVTVLGMYLSAHAPVLSAANCGPTILGVSYGNLLFGVSLFWYALSQFLPLTIVNLHPLALAGWVGLLVTAINLLPAGQLDGGHVFRALLGDRSRYVSYAAVVLLFGLGLLYSGWFIFAILIVFLGMRHPPPLNDITPLDAKRWALGAAVVAVLVTGFVIVPIGTPSGAFSAVASPANPVALPPGALMADTASLTVTNHDLVAHGFLFSGTIQSVVATVNGSSQPLTGAALDAFERNSTWTLELPNGNTTVFQGGGFSVPGAQFSTVAGSGGVGRLTIDYTNSQQATVTFQVVVEELCTPSGGPSPQPYGFTAH